MEEPKKKKGDWADADSSDDEKAPKQGNSHNDERDHDPNAPQPRLQQEREMNRDRDQGRNQGRDNRQAPSPRNNNNSEIQMTGPFVAYVGNLAFSATTHDIGNFFHNGGCNVSEVTILMDEGGKPRGFAHVEFGDRESLISSFEADGHELLGRKLKVNYQYMKSKGGDRGGRMGGGMGGGGDRGGDRDRDNRNEGNREETERNWDRAPKAVLPPKPDVRTARRDERNDRGDARDGDRGGGDRGGDRSYNRGNERGNERGNDRNERGGGGGGGNRINSNRDTEPSLPAPPAVRQKIILAPKKVAVEGEEVTAPVSKVSDIFGGGRPHDENKYEVRTYECPCLIRLLFE